jgi:hypothetical protein
MSEDEQTEGALFGVEPEFFIRQKDNNFLPLGVDNNHTLDHIKQFQWYGSLPPIDKFQWLRDEIAEKLEKAGINSKSLLLVGQNPNELPSKYVGFSSRPVFTILSRRTPAESTNL